MATLHHCFLGYYIADEAGNNISGQFLSSGAVFFQCKLKATILCAVYNTQH